MAEAVSTRATKVVPGAFLGTLTLVGLVLLPLILLGSYPLDQRAGVVQVLQLGLIAYAAVRLSLFVFRARFDWVAVVFWLYVYVFPGVAQLVQLSTGHNPLKVAIGDGLATKQLVLIIAGCIAFDAAHAFGRSRRRARGQLSATADPPAAHGRIVTLRSVVTLSIASLLASPLLIAYLGGPSVLLSNRVAAHQYLGITLQSNSTVPIIAIALANALPFVSLFGLLQLRRARAFTFGRRPALALLLVALLIENFFFNNPISQPRYWIATILIALVVSTRRANSRGGLMVVIAGLVFAATVLFPYLDAFRYLSFGQAKIERHSVSYFFINKGDYASNIDIANSITYSEVRGHTDGRQLLGDLLFWLPRSVWPDKPRDTAELLSESIGYANINLNLDAPLWAEGYIDFGLLGGIAFLAIFGLIAGTADRRLRLPIRGSPVSWLSIFLPAFAGYELIVVRGSLLQALGRGSMLLVVCLAASRRQRSKQIVSGSTGDRPGTPHLKDGGHPVDPAVSRAAIRLSPPRQPAAAPSSRPPSTASAGREAKQPPPPTTPHRPRSLSRATAGRRRASWSLADQLLSSLTNLLLTLLVAHAVSARSFGSFTLVMSSFLFGTMLVRGLAAEPLVVVYAGRSRAEITQRAKASMAVALTAGLLGGAGFVVAGALLGSELGALFVVFGVCLPGLQLQDHIRYVLINRGEPTAACLNDALYAAVELSIAALLVATGRGTVVALTLAWAAPAVAASLLGLAQVGVLPDVRQVRSWFRDHRTYWPRYLGEVVSSQGAVQVVLYAVTAIAGFAAGGALRAAETLYKPTAVLAAGLRVGIVPELARSRSDPAVVRRRVMGIAGGLLAFTIVVGGPVLLLPDRWGRALLGASWRGAHSLLLYIWLAQIATVLVMAAVMGLRAMADPHRSFRAQTTGTLIYCALGITGALLDGAKGAVIGLAFGMAIQVVIWWYQLTQSVRRPPQVDYSAELALAMPSDDLA